MRGRIFLILGVLALAACRGESSDTPGVEQPVATSNAPKPPVVPSSIPANGARQVTEETDTFLFEFSYPQAAGEQEKLAQWLDRQLDQKRNQLARQASLGQEEARDSGFPFNKYSSSTEWNVLADMPGWLSMSADFGYYTGGAHPNYGFDSMVWDKEHQRPMEPIAFFSSPEALDAVLGEQLCQQLNTERERRRGRPVEEGSDDMFDACVKLDETNLLLESSDDRKFDRIGVKIAPYLAGPYAEGDYEFSFPVTAEVLESVREEYRASFAARN